jgi:hypothetical protein
MSHCLNCGKPLEDHATVRGTDDEVVPICQTSVYFETNDTIADPDADEAGDR